MKKKNKGESLIESLISMFLVITIIVPISDLFLKTFSVNVKTDTKNDINNQNENILEILKTKKYDEIFSFKGKYKITDINNFYNTFFIEDKYKILDQKNFGSEHKEIEIKQTDSFYVNEKGNKEYIMEITIGNIKNYYFPELD
ncbi:hypothetical protein EII29_07090 [Leptotrichia sp. OH3620_COT-345]|uniref:hypothetical protein n=1 Tax=Leptotrichia sp. OH3620_COT-345 TaxID=2491048 RepID=UPI000F646D8E|nr:hypothetical protein [Leptotrichia sp. OH3620_COT-345]RRD39351.1 hypothetical protein EII29_07090 [Leptotrichia sp. OH3620_COT-345]